MSEHSVRIKYVNDAGRETRQTLSYLVYSELGSSWHINEVTISSPTDSLKS